MFELMSKVKVDASDETQQYMNKKLDNLKVLLPAPGNRMI
jgi:hypothetical protein